MTSFAVVTPSRGLVHSRTVEAVATAVRTAEAAGHECRGWLLTHDLPIPEAHERVAELGLDAGADALWFVEEDVVPPGGALLASLRALGDGVPIAAVDYPVGSGPSWGSVAYSGEQVAWCGLGCTLIARRVFEALPRPWFRTDTAYRVTTGGLVPLADPLPNALRYGHQDIDFCVRAAAAGFAVGVVDGRAAHAAVRALGQPRSNVGWHRIELMTDIERVVVL